jgi:hypothetical protein
MWGRYAPMGTSPHKLVRIIKIYLNETYGKVSIGKHLSDSFLIQSGPKQDALSPLLFNFVLKYAIRKVQENQVGLKLNGTQQLLAYADDVNLLRDSINTVKKKPETLMAYTVQDTGRCWPILT